MSSDAGGGGVADEKVGMADEEMGVSDVTGGSDGCMGGGVVPVIVVVLGRAGDVLMDGDASSATCTTETGPGTTQAIYICNYKVSTPPGNFTVPTPVCTFGNTN